MIVVVKARLVLQVGGIPQATDKGFSPQSSCNIDDQLVMRRKHLYIF